MSENDFQNEKMYQTTMCVVKKMLADGIITPDEYKQCETLFSEKYHPVIGSLLSNISLTFAA